MTNHFDNAKDEHKFTEREIKAWQNGKNPRRIPRTELTRKQQARFLKLVAELSSPVFFERELGLTQTDIDHYKKELGVETQDDARRLLRKFDVESNDQVQGRIEENIKQQRAAESVAQQRLDQMESAKAANVAAKRLENLSKIDPEAIRKSDAERQKLFEKSQEEKSAGEASVLDWRLELDGRPAFDEERIALFKSDIMRRGFNFCIEKYGASSREIKAEAKRLGLKIPWDSVRR